MEQKKKNTKKYIAVIGLSFLTTIAIAVISGYGITGIELLLPCVFALCIIVYLFAIKKYSKNDLKYTVPIGVILAVASTVGAHIDMDERTFSSMGIKDFALCIFLIPFFMAVIQLLFFSSDVCIEKSKSAGVEKTAKSEFVTHILLMFVCWCPYYLTYYPGGIGKDDFESVQMCEGMIPLTNHHPVAFTGIIKFFLTIIPTRRQPEVWSDIVIIDRTAPFAVMTFVQMVICAIVYALIIKWLRHRGMSKTIGMCIAFAFALHPIVAMYSIYITKDVPFSWIIILLVLFLYDLIKKEKPTWKDYTTLGVLSFLAIILRNNGTLVIVVLAVVMAVCIRKNAKWLILTFAIVLALNGLYKGPVWNALGVEKQSFVESASIPLSQIAYTIQQDGVIDDEDRAYLESIMPFDKVKADYLPGYTDSYKFAEDFNTQIVDDNPAKLMKVWWHMLPDNFGKYVEVYLMQTSGYWCYGVSNTVATAGTQDNNLAIRGLDHINNVFGVSIEPLLAELVLVARKLPLLCMLSQMAIEFLAVIMVLCNYIRRKEKIKIIAIVPLIVLWISVMIASPAHCLFRYMCPVFFLWPILIWEFFVKEKVKE